MQCNENEAGMINSECLPFGSSMEHEQVNFMGNNSKPQNNLYSNNYNAGWRNYSNFSWGGQGNQRSQGSLLSKIETNLEEEIHAITVQNVEGLVKPEKKSKLEATMKSDEVAESKKEHKPVIKDCKLRVLYLAALKRDHRKEQYVLADLRASINSMPYKMFKQLGLGEPKPIRMSIQLADRSIRYPRGIIDDVPMILGRTFLATTRIVIDVATGELVLCVGDEKITFQARDFVRVLSERDDTHCSVNVSNHMAQRSL
ncbi:protein kinase 2B, chloroplastic-like [Gossypium australe]|uniref:Protein kinase 2B, chloroplastic-like n=1 Tax=Gossypium australe TaxID=47621 RepID=A0A5B6VZS0_9ROSI|nr:protein kinase 2B, chloroplastic-like [Gossypium australe]